jgi:hypothetical protein
MYDSPRHSAEHGFDHVEELGTGGQRGGLYNRISFRQSFLLRTQYRNCKTIYLSWDAASWHISKDLFEHIERRNNERNAATASATTQEA